MSEVTGRTEETPAMPTTSFSDDAAIASNIADEFIAAHANGWEWSRWLHAQLIAARREAASEPPTQPATTDDKWWLVFYEDADMKPEAFNDGIAARRTWEERKVELELLAILTLVGAAAASPRASQRTTMPRGGWFTPISRGCARISGM